MYHHYHHPPLSPHPQRRKPVAIAYGVSAADRLWIWRAVFAFGMGTWTALAFLIKALV